MYKWKSISYVGDKIRWEKVTSVHSSKNLPKMNWHQLSTDKGKPTFKCTFTMLHELNTNLDIQPGLYFFFFHESVQWRRQKANTFVIRNFTKNRGFKPLAWRSQSHRMCKDTTFWHITILSCPSVMLAGKFCLEKLIYAHFSHVGQFFVKLHVF